MTLLRASERRRAQADTSEHGRARACGLGMGEIPPSAWLPEG
jgi:hypothetical protein